MKAQQLLSFVQQHYDFERANAILAESNLKNCWKQWFTCELVHMFNQIDPVYMPQTDVYYTGGESDKGSDKPSYLSYSPDKGVEVVPDKRNASRCDFSVVSAGQSQLFEIRCGNTELFGKAKDVARFAADVDRIEAFKKANPALEITALFAFYGVLNSKQIESFTEMDNSTRNSYVLDTGLSGSTSIARLCQMARNGKPRLCLAAFSV